MKTMDIQKLFKTSHVIAVVGLSDKFDRDSYKVADYLLYNEFEIIPINPNIDSWNGIEAYASLLEIQKEVHVDIVDIFRKSEFVLDVVKEAIRLNPKPKAIWMQLGVESKEARELAEKNGIFVVENKCIRIEHQKLAL